MDFLQYDHVTQVSIPQEKVFSNKRFPLTLSPKEDSGMDTTQSFASWLCDNKDLVDKLLFDYKSILFRGFNVKDHNDFHNVIEASGYLGMPYLGGAAVRTQLTDRVFTANESPSSENM